ncbi:hypothetical protein PN465_08830 [Nodularia spumigena CS-584]|jgi:hypothetical protein|uniref:Uncharacterized protein n=2 Tax=Nodularia spumigena TaxID=70799 RepID=A0A166J0C0_NODSP|nr:MULTISPECIES: hypothetical protein [Cyanophyceae]MDB9352418.1 hypothetical protein [Nodularia spumigena CS-588/05]MDB9356186.1 hypothetical protein [Nodularia spumigena CS-587/03]AHJ31339.1 hypothetical protein NSP_50500 [Nodularia spumigena CCY9414]EAW43319.1 hypothetical protein N9414_08854 [Nodularia spumigena CCY9414]KZL49081.1 hypothetical protein A2T98_14695 [Nodularia spumigena CENA596]
MLTVAITIIREMRLFLIIWLGQVITFVGSSITAFALVMFLRLPEIRNTNEPVKANSFSIL